MADMLGYKDTGTCIFYIHVHVVHISRSFQVPRKIFQAHLVCWPSNQKGQKEGEKKSGEKSNPLHLIIMGMEASLLMSYSLEFSYITTSF